MTIKERFMEWRRKRYWTAERQIEHLLCMLMEDRRWLGHDKTATALTDRYLAALAPDWYKVQHTDIGLFRRAIGLEPDYSKKP